MADETKQLTLEELRELNAYFGEHGELPHGVEEALLEMAVGYYELRALAAAAPPDAESLERWAVRVLDTWAEKTAKENAVGAGVELAVSGNGVSWCVFTDGRHPAERRSGSADLARISAARALASEGPDDYPVEPK